MEGKDATGLLDLAGWPPAWRGDLWRETLGAVDEDAAAALLRGGTRRGRPLGSDTFVSKLETRLVVSDI